MESPGPQSEGRDIKLTLSKQENKSSLRLRQFKCFGLFYWDSKSTITRQNLKILNWAEGWCTYHEKFSPQSFREYREKLWKTRRTQPAMGVRCAKQKNNPGQSHLESPRVFPQLKTAPTTAKPPLPGACIARRLNLHLRRQVLSLLLRLRVAGLRKNFHTRFPGKTISHTDVFNSNMLYLTPQEDIDHDYAY